MHINIEDVPTFYINLDAETDRHASMVDLLKNFKSVTRISGIDRRGTSSETMAVTESHIKAMMSLPLGISLILEDDCLPYQYRSKIEIPDDADFVYLGLNDDYKIINKLDSYSQISASTGATAILYVSERSKSIMLTVLELSLKTGLWHDFIMSAIMPGLNVYALNVPIFYQSSQPARTSVKIDIPHP